MTHCVKIPYSEPLNIHSGISAWTNVGSGVVLLRAIERDGSISPHFIQVPRFDWYRILEELKAMSSIRNNTEKLLGEAEKAKSALIRQRDELQRIVDELDKVVLSFFRK
jgi:hypothetical protein